MDLDVLTDPHAGTQLEAGDPDPDPARQRVLLGLEVGVDVPDIGPVRVGYESEQRANPCPASSGTARRRSRNGWSGGIRSKTSGSST